MKTTKNEEQKTLEFLWQFNEIDKFFDKILWTEKFLTYNEKIKEISTWKFKISKFIQTHKDKLKYFWEIRNHITHWIKIDGHTYIYPTKHALTQINKYKEIITKPPLAIDFFKQKLPTCNNTDSLKKILQKIQKNNCRYIPVYEKKKFIGILSEKNILDRISNDINELKNLNKTTVTNIKLMKENQYKYINNNEDIHEIEIIFMENLEIEILIIKDKNSISNIISKENLTNIENYIFIE